MFPQAKVFGNKRPSPVNRSPLPTFDIPQAPDWLPVHTTLPSNQIIPKSPDKDWPLANWFSVVVTGLPWVDGQSSEHPDMVLSYFLHKYNEEWQNKILIAHAERGYTHFMISWPDAADDGYSIDQFVKMAQLVKSYGFYVHVMLGSKVHNTHDLYWHDLAPQITPILNSLITALAVDMVSLWETNLWNIPGAPLQSIIQGIHDICAPNGVTQWVHFSTEVVWWGTTNRVEWWNDQVGLLRGILYQADVNWDMGTRQARFGDCLNNAGAAPLFANSTFYFAAAETDGMLVYTVPFSEDINDLHAYEQLCTPGLAPVRGCCGGRFPNGTPFIPNQG